MESTAERLRKEGRKEGMEKGRRKGLIDTLQSQLQERFSCELSEDVKKLLENAEREKLVKVRDNIFDIEDEEDVRELLK